MTWDSIGNSCDVWVCWGTVSGAQWIIHHDHSQHVTVPVLCQLSHKPLFVFTWQEMRKKNALESCCSLCESGEVKWPKENIWMKIDKRNLTCSEDIRSSELWLWSSQSVIKVRWGKQETSKGRASTKSKFCHQKTPLALVRSLATWLCHLHYLQIWSPGGATFISCTFDHYVPPLAFVWNLATTWRHLKRFQIWSPVGATWVS